MTELFHFYLVYTVGILEPKLKLWMLDSRLWQHGVKTNLFGCFFVCKYVVPTMLEMHHVRIVIVSSVSGKDGSPGEKEKGLGLNT